MTKDLTTGSPLKLVLQFAFPLFLGMLLQQCYNIIDTVIVGQKLGVQALAGVGSTGSLSFMVIGFCSGISTGFAVPTAQQYGAKNETEMRKYVANTLWLCVIYSLMLALLVCSLCNKILHVTHTPDDVFSYAYSYIFIIFLGIPFTVLYNTLAGILRAVGDSKTPVLFLTLSTCLNIVLDLLLIMVFHMGVEGPAIATVFSQAFSAMLCLIHIRRRYEVLRLKPGEGKPSLYHMKRLTAIAIPMGLQTSVTAIGNVIVQSAINGLGSAVVAGVAAGSKVCEFLQCPLDALAQTLVPYAGQNLGAGKVDRIEGGAKAAFLSGTVVWLLLLGFAVLFGRNTVGWFIDSPSEEVIYYAYRIILAMTGGFIMVLLLNVLRFSIQGMGFTMVAICSGAMEMVARGFAGLVLAPRFGFLGVNFAHPMAWFFGDVFLIPAFIICIRRAKKQVGEGIL